MKRLAVCLALAVLACGGSPAPTPVSPSAPTEPPAPAAKVLVLVDEQGVGLGGHDPVSYTRGEPAPGSAEHAASHGGATYQFASADDRTAFEADPPRFAPAYGGYCAFAAAQNRLSNADPTVFLIHEGHLLVFTNEDYKQKFVADPAGNKAKADANWPGLVAKHGK